jgi:hypothetical protein
MKTPIHRNDWTELQNQRYELSGNPLDFCVAPMSAARAIATPIVMIEREKRPKRAIFLLNRIWMFQSRKMGIAMTD